ncbi:MAG TPA: hypothetical protein VF549_08105 [Solirubrobacteraceae bacterium]
MRGIPTSAVVGSAYGSGREIAAPAAAEQLACRTYPSRAEESMTRDVAAPTLPISPTLRAVLQPNDDRWIHAYLPASRGLRSHARSCAVGMTVAARKLAPVGARE